MRYRISLLIACSLFPMALAAQPTYGGVAQRGQTVDHGAAISTIPFRLVTADPGTCKVGQFIYRTDLGTFKHCPTLNTWATISASAAFSALTGGTNTGAAMVIGTGASLGTTGGGTIAATTAQALAANPDPCEPGEVVTDIAADGTLTCDPAGSGGAGFLFNCVSPTTAGASATNYCIGATLNSNEGRAQFQIPRNCTLGALRVRTTNSTGAATNLSGGTLSITIRNGAGDSAVTCVVADGTSSCSDLAHTEAATAGVFSSLKLVGTGYSAAPYVQASYECQ